MPTPTVPGDLTSPTIVPTPILLAGADLLAGGATLVGTNGPDTLTGGAGDDLIVGNSGADQLNGGGGDDTIRWNPGDGSDTVNGGGGFDTMAFNGSNIGEKIGLAATGDHAHLTRDIALIDMDLDNVERVAFRALGGADTFTIGDLRGTDVRQVDIDLGASDGGGDSVTDTVIFDGLAGGTSADRISFSTVDGVTSANGLGTGLSISHAEGIDRLALNTGGGDDTIDATGLAGGIGVNLDGGAGNDALVIKGGASGDIIEIFSGGAETVDGKPIAFSLNGAVGHLSLLNIETVSISSGDGDDQIVGQNGLSPINLTVDAGTGRDTVIGGDGTDTLSGGSGNDFIDGNRGNDLLLGGDGDDTLQWDPGDGSDTVNGGGGFDTMAFNGSNIGEKIGLAATGDHAHLTRDVALIDMDLDNVERVAFRALGGADTFTIGDLRGTDVRQVDIDLGASDGGGDSVTDTVIFDGLAGGTSADRISFSTVDGVTSANGLGTGLSISHAEGIDRLALNTGGGDDTIDATGLAGGIGVNLDGGAGNDALVIKGGASGDTIEIFSGGAETVDGKPIAFSLNGAVGHLSLLNIETVSISSGDGDDQIVGQNGLSPINLTVDAGTGRDTVVGGDGTDTLSGGSGNDFIDGNRGNDLLLGGDGDDTLQWDPGDGSDTVNGGGGFDTMAFNGSNIGEKIGLAATGDHAHLTRDVALIDMDLDNVERVAFRALGGADTFTIGDLRGTDVRQVDIDLGASDGGGDSVTDTVIFDGLAGGASADRISFSTVDGVTSANGLGTGLSISHAEGIDRLALNTGGGDDTIDATGLAGGIGVNLDGGAGNDALVIKGGASGDTIEIFSGGAETVDGKPIAFSLNGAVGHLSLLNIETVSISSGDGDDQIVGQNGLSPINLTVDAGTGRDTVVGGDGTDTLSGGSGNDFIDGNRGNDLLLGGDGDDTLQWDPGDGSDTVNGGGGFDTMAFNGSNIGEVIELLADGKHASLTRNIAGVTMDLVDIDRLSLRTFGGEDVIYLGDLSGTGLRQADIDLSGTLGGGDEASDAVTIIGGIGRDKVAVTSDAGGVHVRGLSMDLNLTGAEAADRLTVSTFDEADTFDFTGFAGGVALAVNGGAGSDRFQFGPGTHANVQIMEFQSHSLAGSDGDVIALKGFLDASFQQAVANNHIAEVGADVVISDAGGVIATLQNVSLATLQANDFLFG